MALCAVADQDCSRSVVLRGGGGAAGRKASGTALVVVDRAGRVSGRVSELGSVELGGVGLGAGHRLGLRSGRGGRRGRRSGGSIPVTHPHDRRAHLDGLTLGNEQRLDGARERTRQLDQRLGGFDLDDHLIDGHGVADLDVPADNLGFGEALADVGEGELGCAHGGSSSAVQ